MRFMEGPFSTLTRVYHTLSIKNSDRQGFLLLLGEVSCSTGGTGRLVLKRPSIIRCFVLLFVFAFMGQGRVGQGFQLLLFADQHACCQTKQHCPISYGKKTHAHSSHSPDCPHTQQKSRASFQCALQACNPFDPDGLVSAQSLRFVLMRSVELPGPQAERRFHFSQPLHYTELASAPPTPPPRSPQLV